MIHPSTAYNWIRPISRDLQQLDEIPLTGNAPPFPWEQLSARLAQSFEREDLSVQPGELTWRTKENLYEGLGDSPFPLNFTIPSLRGQVSWIMPEQEMATLETLLLTKESHPISFQDRTLSESFYRFLALEVLYSLKQVTYDKSLIPLLSTDIQLPEKDALCWDISLHIHSQVIWGRLIISPELRRSWVEHFATQKPSLLSQQLAKTVSLTVELEAGRTHLTLKEWMNVNLGDFIVLDQCALDPQSLEGRVLLKIHNRPVFRGKIKDGNLKILELPLLSEATTHMAKFPPDHDDDEDFSDLDLENEDESDDKDLTEENDVEEEEEDEDFSALDDEEETPAVNQPVEETSPATLQVASLSQQPITADKINVDLVVEVGRIQLTMDQLLKLEPGNLLDLHIQVENGVDLTINGQLVGKGELLQMGDTLGVRVLQLGR